ncbi:hypothetical protein D3C86_2230270 [compost metagenome]
MQEGMGTMLEGLEDSESLGEGSSEMFEGFINYLPLRGLSMMSQGMFTEEMLNGIIQQLNNPS